jgi:hypothetical protein
MLMLSVSTDPLCFAVFFVLMAQRRAASARQFARQTGIVAQLSKTH